MIEILFGINLIPRCLSGHRSLPHFGATASAAPTAALFLPRCRPCQMERAPDHPRCSRSGCDLRPAVLITAYIGVAVDAQINRLAAFGVERPGRGLDDFSAAVAADRGNFHIGMDRLRFLRRLAGFSRLNRRPHGRLHIPGGAGTDHEKAEFVKFQRDLLLLQAQIL